MTRARLESSARPLRERTRRWISLRSGGVRINRLVATNRSYQLRGRYQCYTALVAEFNRQYPGNKARENYEKTPGGIHFNYSIGFPSQRGINVFFQVLLEKDFIREIAPNWQSLRPHKQVCIPIFKGKRVQGWGSVRGSDGRGFNILVVERPNEIYGDIVMLLNRMGLASNAQQRPEPFSFDLNELVLCNS